MGDYDYVYDAVSIITAVAHNDDLAIHTILSSIDDDRLISTFVHVVVILEAIVKNLLNSMDSSGIYGDVPDYTELLTQIAAQVSSSIVFDTDL
jgi:hypothetical protein